MRLMTIQLPGKSTAAGGSTKNTENNVVTAEYD